MTREPPSVLSYSSCDWKLDQPSCNSRSNSGSYCSSSYRVLLATDRCCVSRRQDQIPDRSLERSISGKDRKIVNRSKTKVCEGWQLPAPAAGIDTTIVSTHIMCTVQNRKKNWHTYNRGRKGLRVDVIPVPPKRGHRAQQITNPKRPSNYLVLHRLRKET